MSHQGVYVNNQIQGQDPTSSYPEDWREPQLKGHVSLPLGTGHTDSVAWGNRPKTVSEELIDYC